MMSFTPIGTPCSRPWRDPRSSVLARSRAASRARCVQASTSASRLSMRSRWARITPSAVSFPESICRAISVAVSVFGPDMIAIGAAKNMPRPSSAVARFLLRSPKPRRFRMLTRRSALLASATLPFVRPAGAQQPSTLRIAMTLADIPVTDGAPDQGTEGIRFMGYTMYDPLVMWDLSSATEPAKLVPGLATKWYQDPADPTKWIFDLRQGVKFHDGSAFNADAVIFTLDRALDDKSPAFDRVGRNSMIASLWPIASYRKLDDYKVELQTKGVDTLMPSLLNRIMIASPAQFEKVG